MLDPLVGAGTWLKPEADGGLSILFPRQPKQRALIGLPWLGGDGVSCGGGGVGGAGSGSF